MLKENIILGIDPGTRMLGYGVLRIVGRKAELIAMGIVDMRKINDTYLKLGHIYKRIIGIIDEYHPDELAIEAPYAGVNIQSMLKLGRAQGVAIAAAIARDLVITEYEPRKIKIAVTGNGAASKEQLAGMLQRILKINDNDMQVQLDATDALAAAYCHYLQTTGLAANASHAGISSWKDFVKKNAERVSGKR